MMDPANAVDLPADAGYVVVGAGAVGCAVAAALIESGRSDVLVLDANPDIAQGTTSMGAGMFGLLRTDKDRVAHDVEGLEVIRELERGGDVGPGWEQTGSFRLASSNDGAEGLRRLREIARSEGVTAELVAPSEVGSAWKLLDVSRFRLALFVPEDGQLRPHLLADALRHRAMQGGAMFAQNTRVTGINTGADGAVRAVETDRGTVVTQCMVNAAGACAAGIARMAGLELPIVPVRHSYFVTAPLATVSGSLPHLRFTEEGLYARVRDRGVMVGGWERPGEGVALDPRDMRPGALVGFPEIPRNAYGAFVEGLEGAMPDLPRWPRQAYASGWPTFTPDGQHIVGESRRVPGLLMAAGCNAHGIAGAPALGRLVVESLQGRQKPYLDRLNPDRFSVGFSWGDAITSARGHSETYNVLTVQAA
jgi:glycine/D-amino acid oxidase-like deaminating enzyme